MSSKRMNKEKIDFIVQLLSEYVPGINNEVILEFIDQRNESRESIPKPMITKKEVCKLLSVSLPTVHRMIQRGDIQAIKTGGSVRIPADHIYQLMSSK